MPDVDIDFFDRDNTLKLFKHTPASMIKDGKSEKHKTGVYFHAVPEHPVTGHANGLNLYCTKISKKTGKKRFLNRITFLINKR